MIPKKLILSFFSIMLVWSVAFSTINASSATAKSDIDNHWASPQLKKWMQQGLIFGYSDGTVKPDNQVSRAEFVTMVNRVFGFESIAEIGFKDVKSTDWFADSVAKAKKAGYVNGYSDQTFRPEAMVTREDAAVMLSKAFKLTAASNSNSLHYSDSEKIQSYASTAVNILTSNGFNKGYSDNTFKPQKAITRAEAVTILNQIAVNIFNATGTYSKLQIKGNVVINTTNVSLIDSVIDGDLYLSEGIGNGDATLDKVTVTGTTFINGGGSHSIHMKGSKLNRVVVNSPNNTRVVVDGTVKEWVVESPSILEVSGATVIDKLTIRNDASGSTVNGNGSINNAEVDSDITINGTGVKRGAKVKIEGGKMSNADSTPVTPSVTPSVTPPDNNDGGNPGGGSNQGTDPVTVSQIIVTGADGESTITNKSSTLQMSATVLPTEAADKSVIWSVVNGTGKATISPTGLLTAVDNGTVQVVATANDGSNVRGNMTITISGQEAPHVKVSQIIVTGVDGESTITSKSGTLQMSATVLPTEAADKSVIWSVVNGTGKATISPTGLLTSVDNGTVQVVATANDGSNVTGNMTITISGQDKVIDPGDPLWKLVWNDEFSGNSVDESKWNFVEEGGGFGNKELQHYTKRSENVRVEDGHLVIEARQEKYGKEDYTSAKLYTQGKGDWSYGRFEIRAKLPEGKGMWPAIWMMPTNKEYGGWPMSGEIDIMELLGHEPGKIYGTIHYGNPWTHTGDNYILPNNQKFSDDFHTFSLEWAPGELKWFVDGILFCTKTDWFSKSNGATEDYPYPAPFNHDFYLQLNLAVGGDWPGNPDATTDWLQPKQMLVDYVRVYEYQGEYADPGPRPGKNLGSGWSWQREISSGWNVEGTPKVMRLSTIEGSFTNSAVSKPSNILLREPVIKPGTADDFTITTKINFNASANFEYAGLIVYQDDNNYVSLGRAFSGSKQIRFTNGVNGGATDKNYTDMITPEPIYLRIEKVGNTIIGYYSSDGITWTTADSFNTSLTNVKVGVFTRKLGPGAKTAEFSDFKMNGEQISF